MMLLQFSFYSAGSVTLMDGPVRLPSYDLWMVIPVLGIAGLGSQWCLSKALQIGEATTVIPLDFLRVPIIAGIGWAAYGEELSVWVFTGAAVIMGGIAYGLMAPRKQQTLPSKTATGDPSLERLAGRAA
jgi:drug/metabolite transporter (DMT)-like permease